MRRGVIADHTLAYSSRTLHQATTSSNGGNTYAAPETSLVSSNSWLKNGSYLNIERSWMTICRMWHARLIALRLPKINGRKSISWHVHTKKLTPACYSSETGYKAIVISAEDTDVLIMCLGFKRDIPSTYQKCGTQNRTRFIDIDKLTASLGSSVCHALVGLHAFTGCFCRSWKVERFESNKNRPDLSGSLHASWAVMVSTHRTV